ncbi:MAG: hypothetical protein JRI26_13350 [Deltaproteobacteria bacterium]|nr:hypothetical protein [Deltaproteobacteria bacterium]
MDKTEKFGTVMIGVCCVIMGICCLVEGKISETVMLSALAMLLLRDLE